MYRNLLGFGLVFLFAVLTCPRARAESLPTHDPMYDYPVVYETLSISLKGLKQMDPQLIEVALNSPDGQMNAKGLTQCRIFIGVARQALFCLECYSSTLSRGDLNQESGDFIRPQVTAESVPKLIREAREFFKATKIPEPRRGEFPYPSPPTKLQPRIS